MNRSRWIALVMVVAIALTSTAIAAAAGTPRADKATKASEIGVTPTEIKVAVVADVDTPLSPGLFQGIVDGFNGFAKYINANGGLAGRKLVVDFHDSKLNGAESRNAMIAVVHRRLRRRVGRAVPRQRRRRRAVQGPGRCGHGPAQPVGDLHQHRPAVLEDDLCGEPAGDRLLDQGPAPADVPGQHRAGELLQEEVRQGPARHLHRLGRPEVGPRLAVRRSGRDLRRPGRHQARR